MKRKIYILLMVMLYLVFIGCSDPETALSGKIKISFTDATTFANHSYLFTVYPNNETDPGTGVPISDPLAHQIISIDGNGDGEGFAQTFDTSTDCLFGEGTYYIAGIIDMNDNYTVETPYDSGDRYGALLPVIVDSTVNELVIVEADYASSIP